MQERSPQGELQRILGCQARLSAALEEAGQAMEEAEDYAFSEGTSRLAYLLNLWVASVLCSPLEEVGMLY